VHARIGAPGAGDRDGRAAQPSEHRLELALHRARLALPLPAGEPSTVVVQDELNGPGRHRREGSRPPTTVKQAAAPAPRGCGGAPTRRREAATAAFVAGSLRAGWRRTQIDPPRDTGAHFARHRGADVARGPRARRPSHRLMPPRTLASLAHALGAAADPDDALLALSEAVTDLDRAAQVAVYSHDARRELLAERRTYVAQRIERATVDVSLEHLPTALRQPLVAGGRFVELAERSNEYARLLGFQTPLDGALSLRGVRVEGHLVAVLAFVEPRRIFGARLLDRFLPVVALFEVALARFWEREAREEGRANARGGHAARARRVRAQARRARRAARRGTADPGGRRSTPSG
jgi:hypothetical protein